MRVPQLLQSYEVKQKVYNTSCLVRTVVLSGRLKDAGLTKYVISQTIQLLVTDIGHRKYLEGVIEECGAITSRTLLYSHRLTVHLGFAVLQQIITDELMMALGGMVRFGSIDLTPSLGYEWLRSISIDCKVENLAAAYDLFSQLGQDGADDSLILHQVRGMGT